MRENLFSLGSAIAGIASLFLSDLFAIAIAFIAVFLAFFAARRKEKFYTLGMMVGAVVLIFVNLQNIGILKADMKTEIEAVCNSLRLSNQVYALLGEKNRKEEMSTILDQALHKARKVDTELIDRLVPEFRTHFELEYIKGFSLFKEGVASSDLGKKLKGAVLADLWGKWYNENKDKLEKARQKKPSLVAFIFSD
jgi:hypothetical protein